MNRKEGTVGVRTELKEELQRKNERIAELVAEVERLKSGFVEGIYMGACYCRDGHICTPCQIREKLCAVRLTAERDRYKTALIKIYDINVDYAGAAFHMSLIAKEALSEPPC